MEQENVKQKIQKLLKLQYNAESIGNTGEAYQAARVVRKLLMEYNLSLSDINIEDEKLCVTINHSEDMPGTDRYGNKWKFQLLGVISLNNLCMAYQRMSGKIFIVGTEDNVVIVQELYKYLVKTFRVLAHKRWEELYKELQEEGYEDILSANKSIMNKFYRSYFAGVPIGLQKNYDNLKATEVETALMVCHQKAIEEYVNENYKWNGNKCRRRKVDLYEDVYNMGYRDGLDVSLNRQISQVPKEVI